VHRCTFGAQLESKKEKRKINSFEKGGFKKEKREIMEEDDKH